MAPGLVQTAEQLTALGTGQLLQLGPQLAQLAGGEKYRGEGAGLAEELVTADIKYGLPHHDPGEFQIFLKNQKLRETPVDVLTG